MGILRVENLVKTYEMVIEDLCHDLKDRIKI